MGNYLKPNYLRVIKHTKHTKWCYFIILHYINSWLTLTLMTV